MPARIRRICVNPSTAPVVRPKDGLSPGALKRVDVQVKSFGLPGRQDLPGNWTVIRFRSDRCRTENTRPARRAAAPGSAAGRRMPLSRRRPRRPSARCRATSHGAVRGPLGGYPPCSLARFGAASGQSRLRSRGCGLAPQVGVGGPGTERVDALRDRMRRMKALFHALILGLEESASRAVGHRCASLRRSARSAVHGPWMRTRS